MGGGGYGGNYGGNEPVDTCVADVSGTRPGERGQEGKYSWPETPFTVLLSPGCSRLNNYDKSINLIQVRTTETGIVSKLLCKTGKERLYIRFSLIIKCFI